jgi:hypothetical protein
VIRRTLIERLREELKQEKFRGDSLARLAEDAEAEVERLRAENEKLRAQTLKLGEDYP